VVEKKNTNIKGTQKISGINFMTVNYVQIQQNLYREVRNPSPLGLCKQHCGKTTRSNGSEHSQKSTA